VTGGSDVTSLLAAFGRGDRNAAQALIPLVYDDLRKIAHRRRSGQANWQSPGTTSLVHEVYMNLAGKSTISWESRGQFYYFASVAMRNLLVDSAKRIHTLKRGGGQQIVPVEDDLLAPGDRIEEILAIDVALDRLEVEEQRLARIVECRFFGGLTVEETAEALSTSPATIKRGWDTARTWLFKELKRNEPPGANR
jgi:RNA polymerase sigma factor (TIGR02999 family)